MIWDLFGILELGVQNALNEAPFPKLDFGCQQWGSWAPLLHVHICIRNLLREKEPTPYSL